MVGNHEPWPQEATSFLVSQSVAELLLELIEGHFSQMNSRTHESTNRRVPVPLLTVRMAPQRHLRLCWTIAAWTELVRVWYWLLSNDLSMTRRQYYQVLFRRSAVALLYHCNFSNWVFCTLVIQSYAILPRFLKKTHIISIENIVLLLFFSID